MTEVNRMRMSALVGWLVMAVVIPAQAGLVSWQYFSTIAEAQTAVFNNASVEIIATGQFRAGGATSPEIRVQNGEMDLGQYFDQGNLTWDIKGGANALSAGYGGPLSGFFQLEATGLSNTTDSANCLPVDWFNQVLVDVSSGSAIIDISGNVNGETFNISVDPSTLDLDDRYDAILFTFDNAANTTPVWEMSATMTMTTPFPNLNENDFRSDVSRRRNT